MYRFMKRVFDILLALFGIAISSPFWMIAIVGILVSDPGPIFYLAQRVGKDDETFTMFKFRSMRVGKANESVFRGDEDRIFPFGAFLRSSKIDELPQLLNILLGTMSFVGPRPAAVDQMEIVRGGNCSILSREVAGLTGPAAVYDYIYGDTVQFEEDYLNLVLPTRLRLDVYYAQHMSFWLDIQLIWYTIVSILGTLLNKTPQKIYQRLLGWAKQVEEAEKEATV